MIQPVTHVAHKQRVFFTRESTKGEGWWWMCHEARWTDGQDVKVYSTCTVSFFSASAQGGLPSIGRAVQGALVHRYEHHFQGEGKWVKVTNWYPHLSLGGLVGNWWEQVE